MINQFKAGSLLHFKQSKLNLIFTSLHTKLAFFSPKIFYKNHWLPKEEAEESVSFKEAPDLLPPFYDELHFGNYE